MDAKTPQEDLESLGITSCLAKFEKAVEVEDEGHAHKMTKQNGSGYLVGEAETPPKKKRDRNGREAGGDGVLPVT